MKYSDDDISLAVSKSKSVAGVLRQLGIRMTGGSHSHISSRIRRAGIDTSHFTGQAHNKGKSSFNKRTAKDILVLRKDGYRAKSLHLRRALREVGVPDVCNDCGIGEAWNDKPLTLTVDHIDSNWLDDREENLQLLCPNCHSQKTSPKQQA